MLALNFQDPTSHLKKTTNIEREGAWWEFKQNQEKGKMINGNNKIIITNGQKERITNIEKGAEQSANITKLQECEV